MEPAGARELVAALRRLGKDPEFRETVIGALVDWEARQAPSELSHRETTSGPLVDALFEPGALVRLRLKDGTELGIPYRSKIARDIALRAELQPDHAFEPQTTRLLLRWASRAEVIVVGGAYAGDHVCPVARRMPAGARLFAFEPNPEQRASLHKNLVSNRIESRVEVSHLALWDAEGVRLAFDGHDACARVYPTSDPSGLEATTLDRFLEARQVSRVDILLLDIEGSELRALRGGKRSLGLDWGPDIVFELHRSYSDWSKGLGETEVVRFLRDLGYHVWALRDFQTNIDLSGCAIELVELEGCYLDGPPHGFNLVATRRPQQFEDPAFRILQGVSPKLLLHREPRLHHPTEWLEGGPKDGTSDPTNTMSA